MLTTLTRWLRSWLPTVDAAPDCTLVPTETWLRTHERLRKAEARVVLLERQLAAVEQSHDC